MRYTLSDSLQHVDLFKFDHAIPAGKCLKFDYVDYSRQTVLFFSSEDIVNRAEKRLKREKHTNSRKPCLSRVNTTRKGSSLHAAANFRAFVSLRACRTNC